ncbi:MAG TPA: TrmH family RNA methyltransferase [Candidatus Paceibacterota bacterium]|nr:TrmH family RNA methyltransferase [Candidatus Paceibacterota bacterium]HMP18973.1 TrmH family RNA methyltransferase [Candidatus Paceibacterota bacterium]HMP85403.1 TrmH family RNA methyltransferase [Candidatus Paceibacterota bacterium]
MLKDKNKTELEVILVLHDIRSVLNIGSIFRTSDAVGVSKIYLTGYSPGPIDRFGRERNDFKKTALGSEKTVDWEILNEENNILDFILQLKKQKCLIVGLEQNEKSIDYKKFCDDVCRTENFKTKKIAIFVGREVDGLSGEIIDLCDFIVEIPMFGKKESLNVSVATAIFLFRLLDK